MSYTKSQLVQAVYGGMPYPDQVNDLDLEGEVNAIRFSWRGNRFRFANNGHVEEVHENTLQGSNIAIAVEKLLKRAL